MCLCLCVWLKFSNSFDIKIDCNMLCLKVQTNKQTHTDIKAIAAAASSVLCIGHIIYNHKFITICLKSLFLFKLFHSFLLSFCTEWDISFFLSFEFSMALYRFTFSKTKTNKVYWLTFMVCLFVVFFFSMICFVFAHLLIVHVCSHWIFIVVVILCVYYMWMCTVYMVCKMQNNAVQSSQQCKPQANKL